MIMYVTVLTTFRYISYCYKLTVSLNYLLYIFSVCRWRSLSSLGLY